MTLCRTIGALLITALLTYMPGMASAEEQEIKVVASFSILGDMVEVVAGDLASVSTIVGADADAHIYEPTVADARAVAEADVIFVNGLGFETWVDTLIEESGTRATIYVVTNGVTPIEVDAVLDPHAWNSLANAAIYVRNIATALIDTLPQHADTIAANRDAYIAEMEALDAVARARLAALPMSHRTVVTAHDAFGYLAKAYDLTFLAPQGIDTEGEPSAYDLAILIEQLQSTGAAALFVENVTSPALVQQISDETGIAIGGHLYSDALSERGGPATSYLTMFQHNLSALIQALESPAGDNAKLERRQ